ncbi:MAG: hypothetical protein EXX96DRAFT_604650 [Benjaminiella poitrasii]|nr:MAG: hypothetical protein EXX96DRAFT_604650 [Benjaminiella poitrasii]
MFQKVLRNGHQLHLLKTALRFLALSPEMVCIVKILPSSRVINQVLQAGCIVSYYNDKGTYLLQLWTFTSSEPICAAFLKIFLRNYLKSRHNGLNSKLLSACRPTLTVDPILWLPMSYIERSRTRLWRLGWLLGGQPQSLFVPSECSLFPPTCDLLPPHAPLSLPSCLKLILVSFNHVNIFELARAIQYYWTRGMARPDLILQDLIQAQFPDFFKERSRLSFSVSDTPALNATTNKLLLGLIIGVSVAGDLVILACLATAIIMLKHRMKDSSGKRFTRLHNETMDKFGVLDKNPIMMTTIDDSPETGGRLRGSRRGL